MPRFTHLVMQRHGVKGCLFTTTHRQKSAPRPIVRVSWSTSRSTLLAPGMTSRYGSNVSWSETDLGSYMRQVEGGHRMSSLTKQTVSFLSFVLWESLSEHGSATFRL